MKNIVDENKQMSIVSNNVVDKNKQVLVVSNNVNKLKIVKQKEQNKIQKININNLTNNVQIKNNNNTGSNTAINGFMEEDYLIDKLNKDVNLQKLLAEFTGKKIINNASKIKGNKKSDIIISNICIQHKKTKYKQFGQIDRHYVDNLIDKIPELDKCKYMLKNLCELPLNQTTQLCDKKYNIKKINNNNYTENEIKNLIDLIKQNKKNIINYAFRGYEEKFIPELFSISLFTNNIREKIIFWKMNDVIDYILESDVKIKKSETVIELGNGFTFQRKGGDSGKKGGNNFQFKFIPSNLPLNKALVYKL